VPRTLRVAAAGNRELAVDAIATSGQFDLNFYRQLVRNAAESSTLQPLRRWTTSPNLYLQTGMTDTRTLDQIEAVARAVVPQWTNGQFNVAAVERGPGSRAGQAGWLTVLFTAETANRCGTADIALSGGTVVFYPRAQGCGCPGYAVRQDTVRHEFGHAMGFFHTDNPADVMYRETTSRCDAPLSARERYHAAVAYSRPVGNVDPDSDGSGSVSLAPMRVRQ
jgi:hypothetical protein